MPESDHLECGRSGLFPGRRFFLPENRARRMQKPPRRSPAGGIRVVEGSAKQPQILSAQVQCRSKHHCGQGKKVPFFPAHFFAFAGRRALFAAAGRGFAVSGGVAQAVTDLIHEQHPDMEIRTARAEGLRECRKLMTLAKVGKYNGYLLEGMACPGGCVAGAGTLLPVDLAAKVVGRYQSEADQESPLESAYRDVGHNLD